MGDSDTVIVIRRKATPKPIRTVKINIGGIFHLLDPVTRYVYTCDRVGGTFIWLGKLNEKDEIDYRKGWEADMNTAVAKFTLQ